MGSQWRASRSALDPGRRRSALGWARRAGGFRRRAGAGEGSAWTADPLLVPLAIRAPATASTTIAIPMTATRRIQYV